MTDQKDDPAPDYIWAGPLKIGGEIDFDGYWSAQKTPLDDVEYTRSDLAEARVALAIKQAADLLDGSWNYWNSVAYDKRQAGLSDNQAIHAANETQRLKAAILALPHNPEALEAYVRERVSAAKEEGFWIGRSTGGSKAQIDAAIRAMKGEG